MSSWWVLLLAALLACAATSSGQSVDRPAVFTEEQAAMGAVEIERNSFGACNACHAAGLTGRTGQAGELPALASLPESYQKLINGNGGKVPAFVGPSFLARWGGRSTRDLSRELEVRFTPPAGQLSDATRLNMIAYILQQNGASSGTRPLTLSTDVTINSLVRR